MSNNGAVLRIRQVHAAYGAVRALHGVSIDVPEGAVVAILGANGAGKSTTLRIISGLLAPTAGRVEFRGQDTSNHGPGWLVRHGLVHVPEGRRIFGELTVEENLKAGAYSRPWGSSLRLAMEEVFQYFPILSKRKNQQAATLSGGEQQMLAIGRALMAKPSVLLLDEPSLGLAPLIVKDIHAIISSMNRDRGMTIVVVEQNASLALNIAHWAYVLEAGIVAVSGRSEELRGNEDVRRSYLGY